MKSYSHSCRITCERSESARERRIARIKTIIITKHRNRLKRVCTEIWLWKKREKFLCRTGELNPRQHSLRLASRADSLPSEPGSTHPPWWFWILGRSHDGFLRSRSPGARTRRGRVNYCAVAVSVDTEQSPIIVAYLLTSPIMVAYLLTSPIMVAYWLRSPIMVAYWLTSPVIVAYLRQKHILVCMFI